MIKPAPVVPTPCCGVYAAFLAHPEPEFEPVFRESKETLGKANNWQGRMRWSELVSLLEKFNIQHKCFEMLQRRTVGTFAKKHWFDPDTQYVIWINGHFMTWKNGMIYDQFYPNGTPYQRRPVGRNIIKGIIKIL